MITYFQNCIIGWTTLDQNSFYMRDKPDYIEYNKFTSHNNKVFLMIIRFECYVDYGDEKSK